MRGQRLAFGMPDPKLAFGLAPGNHGDAKGLHGAPVAYGCVLEHPTDPRNPWSDVGPSCSWDDPVIYGGYGAVEARP